MCHCYISATDPDVSAHPVSRCSTICSVRLDTASDVSQLHKHYRIRSATILTVLLLICYISRYAIGLYVLQIQMCYSIRYATVSEVIYFRRFTVAVVLPSQLYYSISRISISKVLRLQIWQDFRMLQMCYYYRYSTIAKVLLSKILQSLTCYYFKCADVSPLQICFSTRGVTLSEELLLQI